MYISRDCLIVCIVSRALSHCIASQEEVYELQALLYKGGAGAAGPAPVFPSVAALLADCAARGLDMRGLLLRRCGWGEAVDEVQVIKLVNFIRAFVRDHAGSGAELAAAVAVAVEQGDACFSDAYMRPTLADDALLFLLPEYMQDTVYGGGPAAVTDWGKDADAAPPAVDEAGELRQRLQACEALIHTLTVDDTDAAPGAGADAGGQGADSGYFGSYSHLDIHEVMLNDRHRTETYAAAIAENAAFIEGKIVLDVGCGTGILSMLAARAGAKMVIGIDVSDILDKTRIIIKRNGYESVIKLVQGKLEHCVAELLALLPEGKVDCIVSEWMGYGLYYENMFASVIFARDRFLRAGGLMLPSKAQLFLEGMTTRDARDDRVAQWDDMYGFQMQVRVCVCVCVRLSVCVCLCGCVDVVLLRICVSCY
jgi:protein arginine N-methyltransferase 3